MTDAAPAIHALHASHDNLAALVASLSGDQVSAQAYPSEWSIAQVASHLGSGAEIFGAFLTAGLTGAPTPGPDVFQPIWDRWNGLEPAEQVAQSVTADAEFLRAIDDIDDATREAFEMSLFGMDADLATIAGMRLGEHVAHTWDIAVALDPAATLLPAGVELLIDSIGAAAARSGRATEAEPLVIATDAPQRRFQLELHPDLALAPAGGDADADIEMPAEALIRLVYGRLDADHTPDGVVGADHLDQLRAVFPGF